MLLWGAAAAPRSKQKQSRSRLWSNRLTTSPREGACRETFAETKSEEKCSFIVVLRQDAFSCSSRSAPNFNFAFPAAGVLSGAQTTLMPRRLWFPPSLPHNYFDEDEFVFVFFLSTFSSFPRRTKHGGSPQQNAFLHLASRWGEMGRWGEGAGPGDRWWWLAKHHQNLH